MTISRRQWFNLTNWFIHKPRVVFTNGCFDVLHVGHLHLLREAAQLGDQLIVGINSDASVRMIKGDTRPIQSESVRKQQLEILPWVHEVHVFDELTPARLIEQIKPDLIVKGSDYAPDQVVGAHVAPVHIVNQLPGHSTSELVLRMQNQR